MRKNLIVLEGADSSGKTTLARAIGAERYFHGLPYVGWVEEAHEAMLKAALKRGGLVVIDRHWISECIYGPIFRGRVAYDHATAEKFDRFIRTNGMYVLCVPGDREGHLRRFARERETKGEMLDSVTEVAEKYRRLAEGYMHEEGSGLLQKYIRHGDFALRDCLIYDVDTDGKDLPAFAERIMEKLS